jgi:hypothetical protein
MSVVRLPTPHGTLALDLGYRTVGWACGLLVNRNPAFGSWSLPTVGGEGAKFAAFENELSAAMEIFQPSDVIAEAMLPLMAIIGRTDAATYRMQAGLRAFAASEAWRGSAAFLEIDAFTARNEVIGRGHFPKGHAKTEVIRFCRDRGWPVADDHQADACITWRWLQMRRGGIRPLPGPLWRGTS